MILPNELIVDLFAGGGGASQGIYEALGRHPDIAVNHDDVAVSVHTVNHPSTLHHCASVWNVEPREACGGRPVGLLWASPDCRHFSRAAGGRPKWKSVRSLPGVVLTWASRVRPRVIVVENVREFLGWGPLLEDGTPCPDRVGRSFNIWVGRLRGLGYRVQWRELNAADYGAPTTRTRLFVVARCDDEPIRWPAATHSRHGGLLERPWRPAADCIDWSIPAPSIFERPRPLAPATLRRIAAGVVRFVLNSADPFIVSVTHQGGFRGQAISDPLATITCANRGEKALVVPVLAGCGGRAAQSPPKSGGEPLNTITAKADQILIAPTLVQTGWGEREGQAPRAPGLDKPLGTVMAGGAKHALVAAFLAQHNTGVVGHAAQEPVSTLTTTGCHQQPVLCRLSDEDWAGAERVAAFLLKYYGTAIGQDLLEPLDTVTCKDRFALVTVAGRRMPIADIGMRMLAPHELAAAQGFPADYVLDRGADGRPITRTRQVRLIGNSVSPPPARALIRSLFGVAAEQRAAA